MSITYSLRALHKKNSQRITMIKVDSKKRALEEFTATVGEIKNWTILIDEIYEMDNGFTNTSTIEIKPKHIHEYL